ncbi:alanyl-tRNA editing protein [Candidatus Woesearchaeota archaeon]|nr:alanyl-tRNA editing protein [Candidatus Woesearchaeota archaeon]
MTTKLFWDDPYQTECTATVTEINGKKIKLDQTIFFAFSGGQASDEGTIGGMTVIEAIKQGDKENIIDIEYTLQTEPRFKVAAVVTIKIDPERRRKLRNLHSAAHLLYYLSPDFIGKVKIIGSNIAPEKARMDFLYEKPLNDLIPPLEAKMNAFIHQNHLIIMKNDDPKSDLRWWTCGEWKMPCGGTHVRSSGEIGPVRLKRVNIGKGKERIEIYLQQVDKVSP